MTARWAWGQRSWRTWGKRDEDKGISIQHVALDDMINIQGIDLVAGQEFRPLRDEQGIMGGAGGAAAVRAFDEGGVERDDVHEHAEAKLLLQETPEDFQLCGRDGWVEEQFDGIVAG